MRAARAPEPERADLAARPRSSCSAKLAAALGPPFCSLRIALRARPLADHARRSIARSSGQVEAAERPYAMVGVNVFAADSTDDAERLFTSPQQQPSTRDAVRPGQVPPPARNLAWSEAERAGVEHCSRAR